MIRIFLLISMLMHCGIGVGDVYANNQVDNSADFPRIFAIVGSPNVLSLSTAELKNNLQGLCWDAKRNNTQRDRFGNVECARPTGVEYFSLSENLKKVDLIEVRFKGKEKFEYMVSTMTKNFGATVPEGGEVYGWSFNPTSTQLDWRHIEIEFVSNENTAYLTISRASELP